MNGIFVQGSMFVETSCYNKPMQTRGSLDVLTTKWRGKDPSNFRQTTVGRLFFCKGLADC